MKIEFNSEELFMNKVFSEELKIIKKLEEEECPIKQGKILIQELGVREGKPYFYNGNEIGTPFNLKDLIRHLGKDFIPDKLGIYHLFYKDELVYIGMSKNVRTRLIQHMKDEDKPFDNVLWFFPNNKSVREVLDIECAMIKKIKPPLNLKHSNAQ